MVKRSERELERERERVEGGIEIDMYTLWEKLHSFGTSCVIFRHKDKNFTRIHIIIERNFCVALYASARFNSIDTQVQGDTATACYIYISILNWCTKIWPVKRFDTIHEIKPHNDWPLFETKVKRLNNNKWPHQNVSTIFLFPGIVNINTASDHNKWHIEQYRKKRKQN